MEPETTTPDAATEADPNLDPAGSSDPAQDPAGAPTAPAAKKAKGPNWGELSSMNEQIFGPERAGTAESATPSDYVPMQRRWDRITDPRAAEKVGIAGSDFYRWVGTAVEQTGRDLYGAVDALLGDNLPELSEYRYFEPKSITGEILSGFGEALILTPATGAAAGALRLGSLASKVPGGARVVELLHQSPIVSGMVRGAPVDFLMSPDGAGLSNIFKQIPNETMQQIGSALGSNEDDSKVWKMIKGMLEGAVVGSMASYAATWFVRNRQSAKIRKLANSRGELKELQFAAAGENTRVRSLKDIETELEDGAEDLLEFATESEIRLAFRESGVNAERIDEFLNLNETDAARMTREGYQQLEKELGPAGSQKTFEQAIAERGIPDLQEKTAAGYRKLEAERGPEGRTAKNLAKRLMAEMRRRVKPPEGARPIEDFVPTDELVQSAERTPKPAGSAFDEIQDTLDRTQFARGKAGVERGAEVSQALFRQARRFQTTLREIVENREAMTRLADVEAEAIDEQATSLILSHSPEDVKLALGIPEPRVANVAAPGVTGKYVSGAEGTPPLIPEHNYGTVGSMYIREPNGTTTEMPVRYALVSAKDVTPTHDARNKFKRNPMGDLNERNYEGDLDLQERVKQRANEPTASFMTSNTPTSTDGPPLVRPNGVVVGGTGRTMVAQLAYEQGGEKAARFAQEQLDAAKAYGVPEWVIAKVRQAGDPVLVRVGTDEAIGEPGVLSRKLNQPFTAARSFVDDALSRGSKLSETAARDVATLIGPEGTLEDVFKSEAKSAQLAKILSDSRVLTADELPGIVSKNRFSKAGKESVETAFLAAVVPDARILEGLAQQHKNALIRALADVISLMNQPDFDFRSLMKDVAEGAYELKQAGITNMKAALQQGTVTEMPWQKNPRSLAILRSLIDDKPTEFAAKMKQAAAIANETRAGQHRLYGPPPTAADAVDEAFHAPAGGVKPHTAADILEEAKGGQFAPSQTNRVFYKAPGAKRPIEIVFENPIDRMIWIAGSRGHELGDDARAVAQALGIHEDEIKPLYERLRDVVVSGPPRELEREGKIAKVYGVPDSKIEAEIRERFGDSGQPRPKPEAPERMPGAPEERRSSVVRPQDISERARGAQGTELQIDRAAIRAAIASGRRGSEAFVEEAIKAGADPAFAEYLTRAGAALFDDLTVQAVPGRGGVYIPRALTAADDVILLGTAIREGNYTAAEEIGHKMFFHLNPAERASVEAEWRRARAEQPFGPVAYKYLNAEEYWADTYKQAAIQGFDRAGRASRPGFQGLASSLWNALAESWTQFKGWLGIDQSQALARQFQRGNRAKSVSRSGMATHARAASESYESARKYMLREFGEEMETRANVDPMGAPANMSRPEKDRAMIEKGNWNNTAMTGSRDAHSTVRAVAAMAIRGWKYDPSVVVHAADQAASDMSELAAMVGGSLDLFHRTLSGAPAELMEQIGQWARGMQSMLVGHAEMTAQKFRELMGQPEAGRSLLAKAEVIEKLEFVEELVKHVELYRAQIGRDFRWLREPNQALNPEQMLRVRKLLDETAGAGKATKERLKVGLTPAAAAEVDAALDTTIPVRELAKEPGALEDWIAKRGGVKGIDKQLELFGKDLAMQLKPAERVAKQRSLARAAKTPGGWDFLTSVYLKHILSGLRTHTAVLLSETTTALMQPGRHWLGAGLGRLLATARGDEVLSKQYAHVMAEAQRTYGHIFNLDSITEAFSAAKRAWLTGEGLAGSRNFVDFNQGNSREALTEDNLRRWFQLQFDNSPTPVGRAIFNPDGHGAQGLTYLFTKQMGPWPGYSNALSYVSSRPLLAADEFVRTLSGRAAMRSILESQAMQLHPHNPGMWREFVGQGMEKAFDKEGRLLSRARLSNDAKRIARDKGITGAEADNFIRQYPDQFVENNKPLFDAAGFVRYRGDEAAATLPLSPDSLSFAVQGFVNRQGWPRLFVPFISSSQSIARTAGQQFDFYGAYQAWGIRKVAMQKGEPVALASARRRVVQELLSSDPRVRSEALGRLSIGAMAGVGLSIIAAQEVADGLPLITGALSSVKAIRDVQKARGLQEYSIYVPGRGYVSYSRLDPLATLVGTIADLVNYTKLHPNTERDALADFGGSVITALAHNFQNKSYLMGVTSLLEAFNDEDPNAVLRVFGNMGASLAAPNLLAQQGLAAFGDDNLKAVRTFLLDDAARKLPYFNDKLPVQRDLLGMPIPRQRFIDGGFLLPFAYNEVSDDVVRIELQKLGHAFQTPAVDRYGLDLRDLYDERGRQAYDRLGELVGTLKIEGRTLHSSMRETIKQPWYQQMAPASDVGVDSPRIGVLRSIRERYLALAHQHLLGEFKDLQLAARRAELYKQNALTGGVKVKTQ